MLYSRQIRSSGIRAPNEQSNFQQKIITFIQRYDNKIDKNYVLFLF
jgi:hypothetical protein|tara:strand:+ start:64 stop:201 length:138 start_codon:yes stop_codon:yes gene_type:complete